MGITSSLVTALSGLSTAQSEIDVVGNNIANVNTVGFKSSRLDFKTQFLENFSFGSAPDGNQGGTNPLQIGLGTATGSITKDFNDGSLQATGNPTNLAIQGDGMFILQNGTQQVYTRDGSFQLNGLNQLVSGSGEPVQGYGVDANFNVITGNLTTVTIPLNTQAVAQATTTVTMTDNLNAAGALPTTVSTLTTQPLYLSDGAGGTDPVNPPTAATLLTDVTDAAGVPLFQSGDVLTFSAQKGSNTQTAQTLTVGPATSLGDLESFMNGTLGINTSAGANGTIATVPGLTIPTDATNTNAVDLTVNGNPGTANDISMDANSLTINRAGSTVTPLTWTKGASADGESISAPFLVEDSLGTQIPVNLVATLTSKTSSGTTWTYYATSPGNAPSAAGVPQPVVGMGTISFDGNGHLIAGSPPTVTIDRSGTGAVPNLTFSLDFSNVTANANTSTLASSGENGEVPGIMQTFQIGVDGLITGSFSNGLSRTVGQVALATFRNDQGLIDLGNNTYGTGPNSGTAIITTPTQSGAGRVVAGNLETSNVDLSSEFVQLIAASTAFSASSRVISSSNALLQDLLSATH